MCSYNDIKEVLNMECSYEGLDYRKIPERYLDKNIPIGRGMVKWQPFVTMPEQYQRVREMMEDNKKAPEPSLENTQRVELEETLRKNEGNTVVVRYWSDGFENTIECQIEYIDNSTRMILCRKDDALLHIYFDYIYEVMDYGGLFDV